MTVEQAKELCLEAHNGQWRRPTTVKTDGWDCYKQNVEAIHENGNKIVWCNGDTFLVYEPFVEHPFAVAAMMTTEEEKIVAYLHDVIEDTEAELVNRPTTSIKWAIHYKGTYYPIPKNIKTALYYITKGTDDFYQRYLDTVIESKLATKVKIADIVHNLSCNPSEKQKEKYLKALPILLAAL